MIAVRVGLLESSPVWVQVVTDAGGRCECIDPGCHGGGRCPRGGQVGRREQLIVGPRDPSVSVASASRLPRAELAAWCPRCLVRAQREHGTAPQRRRWPR